MSETKNESIGGLWLNKGKDKEGKPMTYMAGSINDVKVVVFKNTFKKEGEKTPDYRVYPKIERAAPAAADITQAGPEETDVPF